MTLWQGVLLGLVQGLTEFLPVSSSGHLVVVEALTGVKTPGVFVEVALHVATLGSVLVLYGRRLWQLLWDGVRGRPDARRYLGLLVLGTVPAGVVGLLFHRTVEARFHSLAFVGGAFVMTGFILWSTRRLVGARDEPTMLGALGVGAAQAVAVLPGISRSGSTVSAALWVGVTPADAAAFSFLLAVPVIAGAALLEGRHMVVDIAAVGTGSLAASFVVAFASGIWSIRLLVALLRRGRFYAFAPYCWTVGALTVGYALWHA
ncbi:MAG TPA: undecaprenyl-diphosphate phosphatase [Gemmatimonadales bacterium]|nr:undecaprenyl-diphosphate phosphatase [Gemmatimonadales bacterium]